MSNQTATTPTHPAIDCKSLSELIATTTTDGAAHAGVATKKSLVFILGSAAVENSVFVKSKSKSSSAAEYTVKDCASQWCLDSKANDTLLLSICNAGARGNVSVLNCGMFCSNEAVNVENGRFYAPFGSLIAPVEDMLAHTAGIKHGIEATHINTATTLVIIGLDEHEIEVLNIVAGLNLCEIVYWSASSLNLMRNRECKRMSQVVGQALSRPVTTTKNCPYKFFAGLNASNINRSPYESFRNRLRTGVMRVNVETVNDENTAKLQALKMYFFGPDANAAIAAAPNSEAQQIEQEKAAIKVQQMPVPSKL